MGLSAEVQAKRAADNFRENHRLGGNLLETSMR